MKIYNLTLKMYHYMFFQFNKTFNCFAIFFFLCCSSLYSTDLQILEQYICTNEKENVLFEMHRNDKAVEFAFRLLDPKGVDITRNFSFDILLEYNDLMLIKIYGFNPTIKGVYTIQEGSRSANCFFNCSYRGYKDIAYLYTSLNSLNFFGNTQIYCGDATKLKGSIFTKFNSQSDKLIYKWADNTKIGDEIRVSPKTTTSYTLSVSDNCANVSTKSIEVPVKVEPIWPLTINSSPYQCSGGSFTIIADGAESYSWSPSTGLNTTTGSVVKGSISYNGTDSWYNANYSVTGTRQGCINRSVTAYIPIYPPTFSATPLINGPNSLCVNSPNQIYTYNGGDNYAVTYKWSVSNIDKTTAYISSSDNINPITVSVSKGVSYNNPSITLNLQLTNRCGVSSPVGSIPITVNSSVPNAPVITNGPTNVYSTDISVFQPNSLVGNYTWEVLPNNAFDKSTILSYQRNQVDWNDNFTGIATVRVKNQNGCGFSAYSPALSVNVSKYIPASCSTVVAPSGNTSINSDEVTTFTVPSFSGVYDWEVLPVSSYTSITKISNTQYNIDWNNIYNGTVTIKYKDTKTCGNIWSSQLSCNVIYKNSVCNDIYEPNNTMAAAKVLNVPSTVYGAIDVTGDSDYFKFSTTSSAPNFKIDHIGPSGIGGYVIYIYNSSGAVLKNSSSYPNVQSFTYNSSVAGDYYVYISKYYNGYHPGCYSLTVSSSSTSYARIGVQSENESVINNMSLAPNPVSSELNINFEEPIEGELSFEVFDCLGNKVFEDNSYSKLQNKTIKTEWLNSGIYILNIKNNGSLVSSSKFVKQ